MATPDSRLHSWQSPHTGRLGPPASGGDRANCLAVERGQLAAFIINGVVQSSRIVAS
jgi:hypothetical protein